MDLPDRVQIGPYSFHIELNKEVNDAGNSWGRIMYDSQRIFIDPAVERTKIAESLLHEILHGVLHVSGYRLDDEEKFVLGTSTILLDTMRRNPDVVEFLMIQDHDTLDDIR